MSSIKWSPTLPTLPLVLFLAIISLHVGNGNQHSTRVFCILIFNLCVCVCLFVQALDGFMLVISSDGRILYTSESISTYLGLRQVHHVGVECKVSCIPREPCSSSVQEEVTCVATLGLPYEALKFKFCTCFTCLYLTVSLACKQPCLFKKTPLS